MSKEQKELYTYIFDLFADGVKRDGARDLLFDNRETFFKAQASSNAGLHQAYEGGLADHTALCTLVAWFTAFMNPGLCVNPDDVLIAALFHDLTKCRKGFDDPWTLTQLEKKGIYSDDIAHGILYAHGGWSKWNKIRHRPIAIIIHFGDMIASQYYRNQEHTRIGIDEYRNYINMFKEESKMEAQVNTETEKVDTRPACPTCGKFLLQLADPLNNQMSPFWDCLRCKVRYTLVMQE